MDGVQRTVYFPISLGPRVVDLGLALNSKLARVSKGEQG
jgi:hypothetical protein